MKLIYSLAILIMTSNAHAFTAEQYLDFSSQKDQAYHEGASDESIANETIAIQAAVKESNIEKGSTHHANIFKALAQYHEYKKNHPGEAEAFKKNARELKAQLKDPNSEISIAVKLASEICKDNRESCAQTVKTLVSPKANTILFPQSVSWVDHFLSSAYASDSLAGACVPNLDRGIAFNAILFGHQECDDEDNSRRITVNTYGPGAYVGANGFFYACSGNGYDKSNVGFIAGGGFMITLQTGMFFGGNGVCTILGMGFGVGAYAGIATMNLGY